MKEVTDDNFDTLNARVIVHERMSRDLIQRIREDGHEIFACPEDCDICSISKCDVNEKGAKK